MKTKYCPNCGTKQPNTAKYCANCGHKIAPLEPIKNKEVKTIKETPKRSILKLSSSQSSFDKINQKITLENNQTSIVKKAWYATGFFFVLMILPFKEWSPFTGYWALAFISFFFFLLSVITALMFRGRAKKLQSLITGDSLLAEWTLSPSQKENYINYFFEQEKSTNKGILTVIAVIGAVIFGIFILVIDEGKLFMFLVYIGLIIFLSFFAFGMPYYYKIKKIKADGRILIGAKYAYINGFFHNWDYILSGLKKVKIIEKPFYGIQLVYYYTDRTFSHTEEIFIPANKEDDLEELIAVLKQKNSK